MFLVLERVASGALIFPIGLIILLSMENSTSNPMEKLAIVLKVTERILCAGKFTSQKISAASIININNRKI